MTDKEENTMRMSNGPDGTLPTRLLAMLDRKVFHPEIYEDLEDE